MAIETQVFLNYFVGDELPELLICDGVQGKRTNAAIELAIAKLRDKFARENLVWNNQFNFIGIRTSNVITNKYDDWFVVFLNNTLVAFPATTKAGTPAILKYWNRWVKGIRGFGTIVENQQIDYLCVPPNRNDLHWNSNWTGGLGFLFQDKTIRVYRDQNTDNIIDKNIIINSSNDGFNIHSWKGVNANQSEITKIIGTRTKYMNLSSPVNNMSEGCQCTLANYWAFLFPILKSKSVSNRIIYTLLQWN